jgi:hypothetical protein
MPFHEVSNSYPMFCLCIIRRVHFTLLHIMALKIFGCSVGILKSPTTEFSPSSYYFLLSGSNSNTFTLLESRSLTEYYHVYRSCTWLTRRVLDWTIGFIDALYNHVTRDYRQVHRYRFFHTSEFTVTHALGSLVFISHILATDFTCLTVILNHKWNFLFTA